MKTSVAILHYSYPPVIGGVEFIIKGQAEILARNEYRIKIIAGAGEDREKNIQIDIIPEIGSSWPENKVINKELKDGVVSERFQRLREIIYTKVKRCLEGIDICIIHNVMTMHFNLALTSALDKIISELHHRLRFYLWCHDTTLINPDYRTQSPHRYPWSLLSKFNENVTYITISEWRKKQLCQLFGASENLIKVIPNGIDIKSFLRISEPVWKIVCDKRLFHDDVVMFFPGRIVKRKNYELAIKITKELTASGKKCKLLITAPPDPHNSEVKKYYHHLHNFVKEMELEEHILFLKDLEKQHELKIGYRKLQDLYKICDLLLITSSEEGFGIPLLEAAAMKIPIACSDIAPLSELVRGQALLFKLDDNPSHIAQKIIEYLNAQPTHLMFKRVLFNFSWEVIYKNYLKDLLTN